jgi:hypothetical protein
MPPSSGPWPPAAPRIVARRLTRRTRGASRAPTGTLGRQLTDTMVEHRSLPPSPPWVGRDGKGGSGSKGGEGPARGGQSCAPRKWVSFFSRPAPPCLQPSLGYDRARPECSFSLANLSPLLSNWSLAYRHSQLEIGRRRPAIDAPKLAFGQPNAKFDAGGAVNPDRRAGRAGFNTAIGPPGSSLQ